MNDSEYSCNYMRKHNVSYFHYKFPKHDEYYIIEYITHESKVHAKTYRLLIYRNGQPYHYSESGWEIRNDDD